VLRAACAALALAPGAGIDFAAIATSFRERHGVVADASPEAQLDHVLSSRFVHVRLGLIDVFYPLAPLAEKEQAERLQTACRALLRAQGRWLDLVAPLGADLSAARADLKVLEGWAKSWSPSVLRGAKEHESRDLYAVLDAKDKVRTSAGRFASAMSGADWLGEPRLEPRYSQLVLLPTRRDFVELVCFAGSLYPEDQDEFWKDDVAVDWTRGLALDFKEKTGLEQHVAQRGLYSLMANYFGGEVSQAFTSALAMALVIDLFGEDNTRFEGDLRGSSEPATEVFVPGGNSTGGILGSDLEGRFRETKGGDYFVRSLRHAQKQGAESGSSARARLGSFLLMADDKVERWSVTAPFLGSPAKAAVPPAERFLSDYQELYRAYKTCFVHWLRTEGGKNSADSAERFARLLARLFECPSEEAFEAQFPKVYDGAPFSDAELGEGSLEGRFLRWLGG
jgi:hypothetical protein